MLNIKKLILSTNVTLIVCKAMNKSVEQEDETAETHLGILHDCSTTQGDAASLLAGTPEPRFSAHIV